VCSRVLSGPGRAAARPKLPRAESRCREPPTDNLKVDRTPEIRVSGLCGRVAAKRQSCRVPSEQVQEQDDKKLGPGAAARGFSPAAARHPKSGIHPCGQFFWVVCAVILLLTISFHVIPQNSSFSNRDRINAPNLLII